MRFRLVGLIRGSSKTVSNSQILACELRNYTLPKSELQNGPVHFLPCPIPLRLSPFTFLYHLPSSHLPNSPASRPPRIAQLFLPSFRIPHSKFHCIPTSQFPSIQASPHCSTISPFLPNSEFRIPNSEFQLLPSFPA